MHHICKYLVHWLSLRTKTCPIQYDILLNWDFKYMYYNKLSKNFRSLVNVLLLFWFLLFWLLWWRYLENFLIHTLSYEWAKLETKRYKRRPSSFAQRKAQKYPKIRSFLYFKYPSHCIVFLRPIIYESGPMYISVFKARFMKILLNTM